MQTLRSLTTSRQAINGPFSQVRNVHLEVNRLRQMTQRPPIRDIAIQAGRQPYSAPQQHPAHVYWQMADQIARMGRERDAHIATINHLRLELRLARGSKQVRRIAIQNGVFNV
ncbi:hypothetical protein H4S04_005828 [Coemansia sp. S16]|nr:hypothetical protein H4S04_005828 [Coemansia sp. S16]